MICFRSKHEILSAFGTMESIQQEIIERAHLAQIGERQMPFHGTGIDLFNNAVRYSLSDRTDHSE